jgi:hypothetical protein
MRFQNPAHRQALMALGLLGPSEAELSPETLAERLLAKPAALGEVLYIFKQELAQPLSTFGMIEGLLDMLQAQAEAVSSREELEGVLGEFRQLSGLSSEYQAYLLDLNLALALLVEADISHVAHLVDELGVYSNRLAQLILSKAQLFNQGLAAIAKIIAQKQSLFSD